MRALVVEDADEVIEARLLLQEVLGGRFGGSCLSVRCMRRTVHLGMLAAQPFTDLRSTAAGVLALKLQDRRLDLERQLAGMPVRPA